MNNNLIISSYKITCEIGSRLKGTAIVISDLHDREYEEILHHVCSIKPQYVFLPGDTFERRSRDTQIQKSQHISFYWRAFCKIIKLLGLDHVNDRYIGSKNGREFVKQLSEICDVYISVGNHEQYFDEFDVDLFRLPTVHLLNNTFVKLEEDCIIGGVSTCINISAIKEFSTCGYKKILLCHHPEYYKKLLRSGIPIDEFLLVISGHAHGGQIRIFNKGLFAPGQGIFPKLTKGLYGNHLITTGIANTAFFPRINNPAEICLINFVESEDNTCENSL